jgi:phosphatidylglycerol:prolipoprotein diacylglycerol transferase
MLPNPLFTVFGQGVHMYGICLAVGIVSCLVVFYVYTKRKKMPNEVQDFVFFVAIGAIAIGFLFAKLYQAVYDWIDKGVFSFYNSGMTVMGGLIGGALAFLLLYFGVGKFYFRGKKDKLHIKQFNTVFSTAPICITTAHAFGRLGCLMSGCCHGALLSRTEYVFGGIWMNATSNTIGGWGYYVPTQLYEALFLFALTAVLSVLYFKRVNIIMSIYLIAYGAWRMFIEFLRADDVGSLVPNTISPSQWQSIIFILAGIGLIVFYILRKIPLVLPKDGEVKK